MIIEGECKQPVSLIVPVYIEGLVYKRHRPSSLFSLQLFLVISEGVKENGMITNIKERGGGG